MVETEHRAFLIGCSSNGIDVVRTQLRGRLKVLQFRWLTVPFILTISICLVQLFLLLIMGVFSFLCKIKTSSYLDILIWTIKVSYFVSETEEVSYKILMSRPFVLDAWVESNTNSVYLNVECYESTVIGNILSVRSPSLYVRIWRLYLHKILTYKDGPRAERVKPCDSLIDVVQSWVGRKIFHKIWQSEYVVIGLSLRSVHVNGMVNTSID